MLKKPGNSKYVKQLNRMNVLNIIKEHDPISRQQLAKQTGLTPAAITGIIRELLDMGLVRETGLGKSMGGRRPMKLKFIPEAGYVIGLEITHHETTIGIADLKNDPTDIRRIHLDMSDPEYGIPAILDTINKIMQSDEYAEKKFLGVGIAFPALMNFTSGIVKRSINLGVRWSNFPIKSVLEKELSLPVFVENNSKVAALAERWFGSGTDCKDLIYINLGEGISAGIILDDHILQGSHGYAGQIGHIVLAENGPLCNCGNRGCVEALCGIPAIMKKVQSEISLMEEADPLKKIFITKRQVSVEDVLKCALINDSYANRLLRQVAEYIGLIIADLINTYNPETIFIGGKLSSTISIFKDTIISVVNAHAFPEVARLSEIRISNLGANSGLIGACALALGELLTSFHSGLLEDLQVDSGK
jgi:N-acetylglucosamine repressor